MSQDISAGTLCLVVIGANSGKTVTVRKQAEIINHPDYGKNVIEFAGYYWDAAPNEPNYICDGKDLLVQNYDNTWESVSARPIQKSWLLPIGHRDSLKVLSKDVPVTA